MTKVKLAVASGILCAMIINVSGIVDTKGMQYIQLSIQRSLSAFALARGLNAVISAAQGTEISVEPLGVGLTFTPGEVLDPVNDLIERFSWVMLAGSTAFGIQKILLEISAWPVSVWTMNGFLTLTLMLLWIPKIPWLLQVLLVKMSIVVIFMRFCIPCVFIVNAWLYEEFMQNRYQTSTEVIVKHQTGLQQLTAQINAKTEQSTTAVEQLMQMFDMQELHDRMQHLQKKTAEIANQLAIAVIDLIVVFVLQTLLLPLGVFYALYRLVVLIVRQNLAAHGINSAIIT